MDGRYLHTAITDYAYVDANRQFKRVWVVGEKSPLGLIVELDYNLTFNCLDVYLEDGSILKVLNVKELLYKPNAKEKYLQADRARAELPSSIIYS